MCSYSVERVVIGNGPFLTRIAHAAMLFDAFDGSVLPSIAPQLPKWKNAKNPGILGFRGGFVGQYGTRLG